MTAFHNQNKKPEKQKTQAQNVVTVAETKTLVSSPCQDDHLFFATIVDFDRKFDTSASKVLVVFAVKAAFFLFSALVLSNFEVNLVDPKILSIFLMGIIALGLYIAPETHNIYIFYICCALFGLGAAGCDAAQVTWLYEIYPWAPVTPFIFSFAHSVGTMISPLLALHDDKPINDPLLRSRSRSTTPGEVPEIDRIIIGHDYSESSDHLILFTVAACIMTAATLTHIFLCFRLRTKTWNTKEVKDQGQGHDPIKLTRQAGRWRWVLLVILCSCFIGFYQGLQIIALQFLAPYAQYMYSPLHLSNEMGAQLVFGMTAAFSVTRGLGTMAIFKVPLPWLLYTNFGIIFASNVVLVNWGLEKNLIAMWIGYILFGVGMSTVTSAFWGYIKKYLEMTNFVVCITMAASGVVGSIYPLFIGGHHIENRPAIVNYTIFFSGGAVLLSFLMIQGVIQWGARGQKDDRQSVLQV